MAQLDFPGSPTNGQIFTPVAGGPSWQWDGSKWIAATTGSVTYAPITDPVFLGNPQAPQPAAGDADASIATTKFVSDAVAASLHDVGRNYLHNSMFNVWQRGVGPFTVTTNVTTDRWRIYFNNGSMSVGQLVLTDGYRAGIGDETATLALNATVVGSATPGSIAVLYQSIENARRLSGKTVTVSFWATANIAVRIGCSIDQNLGAGGSPATVSGVGQSVAITTSIARYAITLAVPSLSGKTLGTAGTDYTTLNIHLSSSSDNNAATGSIGPQSASFVIWGVQLELGPTATPLQKLDLVAELQQCQRFYSAGFIAFAGYGAAANNSSCTDTFPVTMRAVPVMAVSGQAYTNASGAGIGFNSNAQYTAYAMPTVNGFYSFSFNWTASADL